MEQTHGYTHWDPDNCFGCKVQTITVSQAAMPTRHPQVAKIEAADKKLIQDLAAYKTMRLQGEHPKSVKGAHDVAQRAQSSFEIESGQLAKDHAKGRDLANGGKEWARRSEEAHKAIKNGETIQVG